MTNRHPLALAAVAGLTAVGITLGVAGPAAADPVPPPPPGDPATPPPGDPLAAPPLPPGPPPVPEMANPGYGSNGQFGSGPLGTLRDLWHQARNPYYLMDDPAQLPGGGAPPPPGAGPAPALPPGFVSMNAPGSETESTAAAPNTGGPPLPEGYYPIDGPPPPGYEYVQPGPPQPAP
ncbi:hypothetical protein [[Mycobacterium] wendilense]|uniref:Uncharacterized protein n=1 Tax=[Mycobacterium] wendilense TaxID=3064284 RepID=A0ABN9NYN4_9MYCO|nr:hypothetical protein [Mycolicibacterium sp. MU0050]CAJ1582815.1 hypothetical protein MU0050_002294 [Mycolicibacterium sp. MU0050]